MALGVPILKHFRVKLFWSFGHSECSRVNHLANYVNIDFPSDCSFRPKFMAIVGN